MRIDDKPVIFKIYLRCSWNCISVFVMITLGYNQIYTVRTCCCLT